jgi:hypothetical protein
MALKNTLNPRFMPPAPPPKPPSGGTLESEQPYIHRIPSFSVSSPNAVTLIPFPRAVSVGIAADSLIDEIFVRPANAPQPFLVGAGVPMPPGDWRGPFELTPARPLLSSALTGLTWLEEGSVGKLCQRDPLLSLIFWPTFRTFESYLPTHRAPYHTGFLNCTGPATGPGVLDQGPTLVTMGRRWIGVHIDTRNKTLQYEIRGSKLQRESGGTLREVQGVLLATRALAADGTTLGESWLIENEDWDLVFVNAAFNAAADGRADFLFDLRDN